MSFSEGAFFFVFKGQNQNQPKIPSDYYRTILDDETEYRGGGGTNYPSVKLLLEVLSIKKTRHLYDGREDFFFSMCSDEFYHAIL